MKCLIAFTSLLTVLSLTALSGSAEEKDYSREVEVFPDVVYGHKFGMALTMDILKPRTNANGAGVIYIVSGAWHSGCFPPHAAFSATYPYAGFFDCRALFDKGFTLFIVRHGDGSKFILPEIMDDVRQSVRFIRRNAETYGVDPERLGALGGSAGGHLAMMLATTSDEGVPNTRNWNWELYSGSDRVAAAVAYFPPTDIRDWFENGNSDHYEAFRFDPKLAWKYSPLLFVTPKSAPALMIHGDKDTGIPITHSENMLAEYRKNNVPCELLVIEGAGHGFSGFVGYAQYTPEEMKNCTRARDATVAWFEKQLAPRPPAPAAAPSALPATITAAPGLNVTAEYAVMDLSAGPSGSWPVSDLAAAPADLPTNDVWQTTKLLLRRIPAGTFTMGSPPDEAGRDTYTREFHSEETLHTVTLTKPFYIGVFPVTQKQWSLVMGNDPSWFNGNPKRPVENVSWNEVRGGVWPNGAPDAAAFIGRLCAGSSQAVDLPTEAQWEYACRAGTIRAFNDPTKNNGEGADCTDENLDPLGWYEENARLHTHDVGERKANAWGLYDMHGNAAQWCLDWHAPYPGDVTDPAGPDTDQRTGGRILRGGYFSFDAPGCRSAARNYDSSAPQNQCNTRYSVCGFRLVLNTQ